MIEQWVINEPKGPVKHCVLCLPGRSNTATWMVRVGDDMELPNTLIVSVQPRRYQWYPQPYSAEDQAEAVAGLPKARRAIRGAIKRIMDGWSLKEQDIALVGFSAGAVMALEVAVHHNRPFAAAVSLAGAMFEPHKVPTRTEKNNTPLMLVHYQGDFCFDWDERYIPMKTALATNGYKITRREAKIGGHTIYRDDVEYVAKFIAEQFGYENWTHPRWAAWGLDDEEEEEEEGDDS